MSDDTPLSFKILLTVLGVGVAVMIGGALFLLVYAVTVQTPLNNALWAECSQYETIGAMPAKCAELFK